MKVTRRMKTPRQSSDKSPSELVSEYLALLDENQLEQRYQTFIEKNTSLVPREFIQNHGIHFDLVLRKLAFGGDYKSDFAYLSKSSDDWNAVLIEIERPNKKFFKDGHNDFHADFQQALQQINRWKAWFLVPGNFASFVDGILGPIRKPLTANPTYMKYVLVYGRRSEYADNDTRRRLVVAQEGGDFKIMTFDSLSESLHTKTKLYVGAKKNEYIDILSDEFLSENMFAWMDPTELRISEQLKASAVAARGTWHHYKSLDPKVLAMDYAFDRIRLRP